MSSPVALPWIVSVDYPHGGTTCGDPLRVASDLVAAAGLDEAAPGCYDARARLAQLDEWGIEAQVLYPNVIGFFTQAFAGLDDGLGLECVRAYNDFLVDFASVASERLLPIAMLPIWDVAA